MTRRAAALVLHNQNETNAHATAWEVHAVCISERHPEHVSSGAHVLLAKRRAVADGVLEHDILGLYVAVHDVVLMQVRHRREHLAEHCRGRLLAVPLELHSTAMLIFMSPSAVRASYHQACNTMQCSA